MVDENVAYRLGVDRAERLSVATDTCKAELSQSARDDAQLTHRQHTSGRMMPLRAVMIQAAPPGQHRHTLHCNSADISCACDTWVEGDLFQCRPARCTIDLQSFCSVC